MNLPCESKCGAPVLCQYPVYGTVEEKNDFIARHPSRYGQSERSRAADAHLIREERGRQVNSEDLRLLAAEIVESSTFRVLMADKAFTEALADVVAPAVTVGELKLAIWSIVALTMAALED